MKRKRETAAEVVKRFWRLKHWKSIAKYRSPCCDPWEATVRSEYGSLLARAYGRTQAEACRQALAKLDQSKGRT